MMVMIFVLTTATVSPRHNHRSLRHSHRSLRHPPDDIFAVVIRSLTPRDVFNLSIYCRSLYALASSDKVWLTQCELLGVIPHPDLIEWRKGVNSYKSLCRFLINVMPGFISVVGCRIIPQELGPLGIE
ncbi:hypothetical protein L2E82_51777 [Cichorium intybus]|nr:hypothetical protein L2E82_51777 [Cichorium intybus]